MGDLVRQSENVRLIQIGLSGDLGAGKTTFVQGLARGLGIDPKHYVSSPTFTLINEYLIPANRWGYTKLVHVDLYRIDHPREGQTLGLEEYLVPGHVVVIEWVEKIPELQKRMDYLVRLESGEGDSRVIHFLDSHSSERKERRHP